MGAGRKQDGRSTATSKARDEIDNTRDDGELGAVGGFWVAVSVGENAKGLQAGDGVFDAHTEAAEAVVVSAFVLGQRFFLRSFIGDVRRGVVVLIALIAAVGVKARALGQRQRNVSTTMRQPGLEFKI